MGTAGGHCTVLYKSNNVGDGGIGVILEVKIGPCGGLTTWGTTKMMVQKYF
jgi:hypothetical protein